MSEESSKQPPSAAQERSDATGEFFTVGTPLHAVRAGYVKRKADNQLYDTILSGQYAHVLAPDRSGKTSLIAATAARLEALGCRIAVLDLAQIGLRDGGNDPGRWYYNVAYRLLRQLRIRYDLQGWWHDRSILSNRQRLLEFYSEILLHSISERIIVFVDEIQCIENRTFADQLLASFRAAHNARTTDPDFSRLSFVLLGECDPVSLISEPELSPFNITQQIVLDDFNRKQLDLFATEMNLGSEDAKKALDRIFYWTRGQPYLSQKLARQVARDDIEGDVAEHVDHVASTQIGGRAALHSEPHMGHIHRRVVDDEKLAELMLNLYGRVRKGIEVSADLGSPEQRRLIAIGLLVIDREGHLQVRNRLYESVFTARWANENLPIRLRVPLVAVGMIVLFVLAPFWYTQWLPRPYMEVLTSPTAELDVAYDAYRNFRSFPGHADTADNLFRGFVQQRATEATNIVEINAVAELSRELPDAGRMPESLLAAYWDRRTSDALRDERRDTALMASLESLVMSTPRRRQRAASLVGDDYPMLLATLPPQPALTTVFDPANLLLTFANGPRLNQWSYATQTLQQREEWSITALEVVPLVRRVVVDRQGTVSRIGLTLNLSHARLSDLRIKLIAPSGRAVEIETGRERSSSNEDIRIPSSQLQDLVGEQLSGTWSVSVRDEALGVAGQLVGWNLKLNAQGAVEDFQRGLNIPEPAEREAENVWFDKSGRYAVARAMQSDSARIWDLAFAEPVRVIAVNENEDLIGVDKGARRLVTATRDSVSVWDTSTGDRLTTLPIAASSDGAMLTGDGLHLFVEHHGDVDTRLELWSLQEGRLTAALEVAGVPALVAVDPTGRRVAVADFDRAVRVWDFESGELLAQIDLPMQPGEISLAAEGEVLSVVHERSGISVWNVSRPRSPLVEEYAEGDWQVVFSPSGSKVVAGRAQSGYQVYSTVDGRLAGSPVGVGSGSGASSMLAFGEDENVVFAGSPNGMSRFWRTPEITPIAEGDATASDARLWRPSADRVTVAVPGAAGIVVGDELGQVHFLSTSASQDEARAAVEDLTYIGHTEEVVDLEVDDGGSLVASAAADDSIRVWEVLTGEPRAWTARLEGDPISRMTFSPGARTLAVLRGSVLTLLDVKGGSVSAEFELGEVHASQAFATEDELFIGSAGGVLSRVARDADGAWSLQQLWRGLRPIRELAHSPRANYLVIVDDAGLASLFNLVDGHVGERTLQLPGPVEEVTFARSASRALVRTARWVHRVNIAPQGLMWIDSVFAPKPLQGARIVFGSGENARRAYLPAARNGFIELEELAFPGSSHPGLLGNRDELLAEWRSRVGYESAAIETN
jgi:WD40 repeat protein